MHLKHWFKKNSMRSDWTQIITFGTIVIGTPPLFRWFLKQFPAKIPTPSEQEFSAKEMQKWTYITTLLLVLSWGIIFYPLRLAFDQIYHGYLALYQSSRVLINIKDAPSLPAFIQISVAWLLSGHAIFASKTRRSI